MTAQVVDKAIEAQIAEQICPRMGIPYGAPSYIAYKVGKLDEMMDWDELGTMRGWSAVRAKNEVLALFGLHSAPFNDGDPIEHVSINCVRQEDARRLVEAIANEYHDGDLVMAASEVFNDLSDGDFRLDYALGLTTDEREGEQSAHYRLFGVTALDMWCDE